MRLNVRIHRQLAFILFLPLLASALTRGIYRLGRSWFGLISMLITGINMTGIFRKRRAKEKVS